MLELVDLPTWTRTAGVEQRARLLDVFVACAIVVANEDDVADLRCCLKSSQGVA